MTDVLNFNMKGDSPGYNCTSFRNIPLELNSKQALLTQAQRSEAREALNLVLHRSYLVCIPRLQTHRGEAFVATLSQIILKMVGSEVLSECIVP